MGTKDRLRAARAPKELPQRVGPARLTLPLRKVLEGVQLMVLEVQKPLVAQTRELVEVKLLEGVQLRLRAGPRLPEEVLKVLAGRTQV